MQLAKCIELDPSRPTGDRHLAVAFRLGAQCVRWLHAIRCRMTLDLKTAVATLAFVVAVPVCSTGNMSASTSTIFADPHQHVPVNVAADGESIFSSTIKGVARSNKDVPGVGKGIPIELGQVFQVNSPGNVTSFRHYAVAQEAGKHVARIWRESDGVKVYQLPTPQSQALYPSCSRHHC